MAQRSEGRGLMMFPVLVLGALAVFAKNLPQLVRYVRIKRM